MNATSDESRKLNLLVVDDERLIADSLAWILNLRGFNARSVYSGTEAIDHAVMNPIDILISDVVMEGTSGIDAAIEICKLLPTCKVLLFSGNIGTSEMLKSAHDLGHDFDILAKPAHPDEIIDRLKTLMGDNSHR
jgi:DNA-binding NtrC family response regulator